MATVRLWQRFEVTVNGIVHHGGSLTTDTDITAADGEVFDTTIIVPTLADGTQEGIKVFDVARDLGGSADFDFMWIENLSSTASEDIRLQFTADAGTDDDYFVKLLEPGETLVFGSDAAIKGTSIDVLSTSGEASTIDEIWAGAEAGTPSMRIFAIT